MGVSLAASVPAPADAIPRSASWRLRVATGAALAASFWIVSHSLTMSVENAQVQGLNPNRLENRFAERQSHTQTNSVIGFFAVAGIGAGCWLTSPSRRVIRWNAALAACAAAYLGWCFLSFAWSIAPALSVRKEGILAFLVLAAFGLAVRFEIEDFMWVVIIALAFYVGVGFLAEIRFGVFRPWLATYRFTGTVGANDQGLQCALLALTAAMARWPGRDRPWLRRALVALGLAGLWLSKSRTALAAFVVAAMMAFVLRARGAHRWFVLATCLMLASVGAGVYMFASAALLGEAADVAVMGRGEDVNTLTGRLPLWADAWAAAQNRLLLGHGYGAYWNEKNVLEYSDRLSWHIPHSHNAYIDQVLSVGAIGLTLYVLWILASLATAERRYRQSGRLAELYAGCVLLFSLVHGASESKLPGGSLPALVHLALLAMLAVQPARQAIRTARTRSTRGPATFATRPRPAYASAGRELGPLRRPR